VRDGVGPDTGRLMAPVFAVFESPLVGSRRTWRASALSSFLLPLLTVLGFGVGVGAYVDGGIGGVPYVDWVVPGLLASTVVQVGVGESTWPVLSKLKWIRIYHAQAAAPLRVRDILGGHLAFVVFRALLSSAAFLLVAAAFGTLHSGWVVATLPVVVLLGFAVAAPTFAYSASVDSDSYLVVLFRFVVVPMSLFAGVFFPVGSLPVVLRWLAYASPLWHGVDLCRAATLGTAPDWSVGGRLLSLGGWDVPGWLVARSRFHRKLVL